MKQRHVTAFADEFGNNSFDFSKDDISSHFIIASIIVNSNEVSTINTELEIIRKKFFQTGEMKSQKIGSNHKRRMSLLSELNKLKYFVYAVIVDKKKLYGEGFRYKQSFYKYLNGLLYKELYRTFPNLELKVDEYGTNDFMRGFKEYVETHYARTLFSDFHFNMNKSHNELGVQLADIIAGTLGYIYDDTKKGEHSKILYSLLKEKITGLNRFPRNNEIASFNEAKMYDRSEYDDNVAKLSLRRIFEYLDNAKGGNQDEIDSMNFLNLLVRYHESNHQKTYTRAAEFKRHLNVNREQDIGREKFTNIIGKLRDKGILIASSRDGYKIPTSVAEIKGYVRLSNSMVLPLLNRIAVCREAIKLSTSNSLDVLDDSEFSKLKELVDIL